MPPFGFHNRNLPDVQSKVAYMMFFTKNSQANLRIKPSEIVAEWIESG